jgi:hypothetical protein
LDGAARQFSEAYDTGLSAMQFVNKARRDGKLIMGIGHRVKSVSVCVCTLTADLGLHQHKQSVLFHFYS